MIILKPPKNRSFRVTRLKKQRFTLTVALVTSSRYAVACNRYAAAS